LFEVAKKRAIAAKSREKWASPRSISRRQHTSFRASVKKQGRRKLYAAAF